MVQGLQSVRETIPVGILILICTVYTPAEAGRNPAEYQDAGLTTADTASLPSVDILQAWHLRKDAGGPTFAGNPSWWSYLLFLEQGMKDRGVVDIKRETFTYQRWYTSDDRAAGKWSLQVDGTDIGVASYWAYSGETGDEGITARLVAYKPELPVSFYKDRIIVFEVPSSPETPHPWFRIPVFEHATDPESIPADPMDTTQTITYNQFYQLTYATLFGGLNRIVTESAPAGALVIFNMSHPRAAGLYTFPVPSAVLGAPGLYLDRVAGAQVKAAMKNDDRAVATLKLVSNREETEVWFLSGVLPGRDYGKESDEMVLLISHTDGPSLTQENGPLGILGVLDHLSGHPQASRRRSILVLLDPSHFMPPGSAPDWYERNPGLAGKIVASVGIEHLGQVEYKEQGGEFLATGRPELTGLMAQDNDVLIKMAIEAVTTHQLPRTLVYSPSREEDGVWFGMGKVALERNIPGLGIMGFMGPYWATTGRLDKFDAALMVRQIAAMAQLTEGLMTADLQTIAVKPRSN